MPKQIIAADKSRKQESAKSVKQIEKDINKAFWISAIRIVAQIAFLIIGLPFFTILGLFDGWCAGGHWCSSPPGINAFLGDFFGTLCITQFFLTSKKFKNKRWIILGITLFIAIALYLLSLKSFYQRD